MKKHNLLRVVITFILLSMAMGSASPVQAAAPYGVDHLRGRWDGVVQGLFGSDQPFVLMLDEFGPDPNNAQAYLYGGCMAVGEGGAYAPVSARVLPLGNENFDLTLFGTAWGAVIKLAGTAFTGDPRVKDDPASGAWQTAFEQGDWFALHHDRREPTCPAVNLGDDLFFQGDVYAAAGLDAMDSGFESGILEGFTNIVSTGMRVTLPGGGTVDVPFFTDIFSPSVNFVDSFRFLTGFPDFPVSDGSYGFTLLDVFGQPIAGATSADIWLACPQDAPRNVTASVDATGITASWDPVSPAAGFDPGGIIPLGFYQIELNPLAGDGSYGAGGIHQTSHLIPFATFGGFQLGSPDGEDFGMSLDELTDGTYVFDTIAFSQAVHAGGFGLECQIRALDEQVQFGKTDGTIIILP